ncbi:TetR/AcrR family transcriptional regulator [Streptomyces sp. NBRC 110028]|uniref:TetR/AcrR family transcriptional regulator n=1 Tax=Streptomyces sp. NBRC 110028 TaxID=1621260 RepID=UPI0007C66B8C|nr:TetR/AcrR family transcriptional regulator [Streptomyces sp. NBRC 110028]
MRPEQSAHTGGTGAVGDGKGSGQYAKGRARREEILRTALQAFADQGFRATSMREIAEAVGLSQAGLLHHFRSKDDLLAEVLRLRDSEIYAFNQRFGQETGLAALSRLVDMVELNARQAGLVQLYTVLSGESVSLDHPAQPYFTVRYAELRERVAGYLRTVRDEGRIREDVDPEQAAAAIIAVMDGLQIQWLLAPSSVDMPEVFARFLDDYLRGLA